MLESLRLRSLLVMGVSAAAVLAVAAPAFAADEGTTVADVIVTAQKKEEALQDVPIAVSAFSQDSLEKQKIDGGPNLVTSIPNVNFSKGNFTGYNFQIRGVGSKLVSGSGDAGTGIHLNNAPLTANNLFEAEFFDVERVEVLRGPQGTLYGRNATGGVVNMITAKPILGEFSALGKIEYGNYNSLKIKGMINIPLGDDAALRVAAVSLNRDGYGKNTYTHHDVDDRSMWDVRATLAWNPSDSFKTYLLYDHFDEDDKRSRIGRQFCAKDNGPGSVGGVGYSAAFGGLIGQIERGFFSQGCKESSLYAPGVSTGTLNTQATLGGLFGALTGLQTGDALAGKVQDKNIRNIESTSDPVYQSSTDIYEFNVSWDLTDDLQLTSLSSYSTLSLYTRQDYNRVVPNITFNASPNPVNAFAALGATYNTFYTQLFPGGVVNDPQNGAQNRFATFDISAADTKQFTQELRLQSDFDGPINFNVGAIYLDYKATGDYYVMFNTGTSYYDMTNKVNNFTSGGAKPYPCPAGNSTCVYIDPGKNPNRSGHNYYDSYGPYHLKSRAAFGEVYWQLTDAFKITGGLRYTDDSKSIENHSVCLGTTGSGTCAPPVGQPPLLKVRFQEFTGRLGFDWKLADRNLVYFFYSKGYKAGGANPACSPGVGVSCPPPSFAPEFVNSFELGTKNTFLDGSLLLNGTAFYYDYKGYQVSKIVNRTSINENIDAKIKGLEIETIWNPIRGLRLNANIGYLNTEIVNGTSIDTFNRTGGSSLLTLVKSSAASNCVVRTSDAAAALTIANGANNPFALLQVCSPTAFVVPANTRLDGTVGPATATNPLATGRNAFLQYISDGVPVDLKGNELPNSPHYTLSLGAQYTWDLGDWSTTLRGDYYKQTDTFSRIYNSNADKIQGWSNVNITLTVANPGAGLVIDAFVKNATDETAITDTYLTDDSSGLYRNAFYTEPRTFGVAVSKTF